MDPLSPALLDAVLRDRFGLERFHPWQREAIDALLRPGGRVLVVAPTGGGKSLTYQVPAAVLGGMTLVLSPLVALMEDQVRALEARGVSATFIASTLDPDQRRHRESWMLRGRYKLVYVAPERLASNAFVEALGRCNVQLVAVDEAHCIAQWGHDFRPDYLRIGALLEKLRPPRVLACTATATPEVRREIRHQLRLGDDCHEVLRGFARPNLHLAARNVDGVSEARSEVFSALSSALGEPGAPRGGAIVYAATRSRPSSGPRRFARRDGTRPRTTRGCPPTNGPTWRRALPKSRSRSWSPPTRSGWASIAPTSGRCFTCNRRPPSRRTTRRWGARAGTAQKRGGCSSARAPTSRSDAASSPRGATAPLPRPIWRRARGPSFASYFVTSTRARAGTTSSCGTSATSGSCWAAAATATSAWR